MATGRLDSDLVYVDEYLIDRAKDLGPEVYIRRLLGGFVMTYGDPEFGTCALSSTLDRDLVELSRAAADSAFGVCRDINTTSEYNYFTLATDAGINATVRFPWLTSRENCPALYKGGNNGSRGAQIDGDSLVEGLSANLFQQTSCALAGDDGALPVLTLNRTERRISATVYYNNNVSWVVVGGGGGGGLRM